MGPGHGLQASMMNRRRIDASPTVRVIGIGSGSSGGTGEVGWISSIAALFLAQAMGHRYDGDVGNEQCLENRGSRLPQIPDLTQREVLAWVDELIREVATGANREWENPWLERYVEAMWAWLDGRPEPAWDSLDRRMIGHILSPSDDSSSLVDYLAAVKRRVESPADGWPPHLEIPQPAWGMIGVALRVARSYE